MGSVRSGLIGLLAVGDLGDLDLLLSHPPPHHPHLLTLPSLLLRLGRLLLLPLG